MAQAARKQSNLRDLIPTAEFETISPAIAEEWLTANAGNRSARARQIDTYAREIRAGGWLVTGETIKFDRTGRLIDGQHRLKAVIVAGEPINALVVRNLDPAVQAVIDTPTRRSAGDALVWAGLIEKDVTMNAAAARLGYMIDHGIMPRATRGGDQNVSHSEIIGWVKDHPGILESSGWTNSHIRKIDGRPAAVCYVHYRLHELATADAERFFEALVGLSTRGQGDPLYTLISALRTNPNVARSTGGTVAAYFLAWNAFRDDQKLSSIRITDAKGVPIPIPTPL